MPYCSKILREIQVFVKKKSSRGGAETQRMSCNYPITRHHRVFFGIND